MKYATTPPTNAPPTQARTKARPNVREILNICIRDPLTHFLLIGCVIYAASAVFSGKSGGARLMRLDQSVYGGLVDVFASQKGRAPSVAEMSELADRWVLNETLYREAAALGLDRGDDMIRERIMQKMRVLLQSSVIIPEPEDGDLRSYFETNRDLYEAPEQVSFSIARIDGSEQEARKWARMLEGGETGAGAPRVYPLKDRPKRGLVEIFGDDFVARIEDLPVKRWDVIESGDGWQAVRLESITSRQSITYAEAAKSVRADWEQQAYRDAATAAMEALIDGYDVEVEPYDPSVFAERAETVASMDGE